jgi:hypothetical protein
MGPGFAIANGSSGWLFAPIPHGHWRTTTGDAIAAGLRCLRHAGDPGYEPAGKLAGGMAIILRARLGTMERLYLASAALLSLDRDSRQELVQAADRDQQPDDWPFPGVDREMFNQVCREHRSPPLTKIEQRRADAISFDDTPRETLAHAWNNATDRDRRDLVNRATGRIAA